MVATMRAASGRASSGRSGRRHRTGGRLATLFFVVLTLVGTSLVAASVYLYTMRLPPLTRLSEATTVYYADGTVMARLGSADRTVLASDAILSVVKQAAVAAADPGFWDHGSSPISRSVVRQMTGLDGSGYPTRLRASVLAARLEKAQSKEEILTRYLNAVAFGRAAFGVEAAARVYFAKSANKQTPRDKQLSTGEAILLAAAAQQPGEPVTEPAWAAVRTSMVKLGYLTDDAAQALTLPQPIAYEPLSTAGPTGHILNHVLSELTATQALPNLSWSEISNGGYQVTTTIEPAVQTLLEHTVDETVSGSLMHGQPDNLQAAAVAVQPGTGRVLAYFGGHSGSGADFAGWYRDKDGDAAGYGAHPPAETFQAYILAAALKAGISVRSRWRATSPMEFPPERVGQTAVRNSAICPTGSVCTLADATQSGLNTPYYALTTKVGVGLVVHLAAAAGIDDMWVDGPGPTRVAITGSDPPSDKFGPGVGLGQYPVTVLDQANAMATFAANARPAPAHFVRQVAQGESILFTEKLPKLTDPALLSPGQAADLTWALSRGSAGKLTGRPSASLTGAWEPATSATQPVHAWIVGYTANLACAVWVGNKAEEKPLRDRDSRMITGGGLPASIYRTFMEAAHTALALPVVAFPKPSYTGDPTAGNS